LIQYVDNQPAELVPELQDYIADVARSHSAVFIEITKTHPQQAKTLFKAMTTINPQVLELKIDQAPSTEQVVIITGTTSANDIDIHNIHHNNVTDHTIVANASLGGEISFNINHIY
jgi:hypothetical protein